MNPLEIGRGGNTRRLESQVGSSTREVDQDPLVIHILLSLDQWSNFCPRVE
jgi:hypothetical protein